MAGRSDAWARQILLQIWEQATGSKPTLPELQYVQAVSAFEGGYGGCWNGSNNWGAIQCTEHKQAVPGHCMSQQDTHADGTKFVWPYRVWPTPEEGALAFVPLLTVKRPKTWAAMKQGDVRAASHELYGYYTGVGSKEHIAALKAAEARGDKQAVAAAMADIRADGEAQHRKAVMSNAERIAKNLGEKLELWVKDSAAPSVATGGGAVLLVGGLILGAVLLRSKGRL